MFAPRCLIGPALLLGLGLLAVTARADGPQDNIPDNVRPVPPVGVELPAADLEEIKKGLAELQADIKAIGPHELLPDVLIYEKAVRWAIDYKEVFDAKGIPPVKNVLKTGLERARALKEGKAPWTTQTGLVVRGYRSKIDGSVQPYGLVVPASYDFKGQAKHRLDFWWHGRGETLSEANFIDQRQRSPGEFTPPDTLVLHPYGRYCNANKFAGEIDSLECLDHARKHYRIDENRIVARGFSMGGAACWQYAVHYPTLWCAAAPGAGFAETPEFLKEFQKEDTTGAPWYEKKLWHMYNASDYAANIFNLPTVAYSGEIDRQKQAADVMAREMKKEGLDLVHIIGPKTGHAYEKGAKEEVNQRIDAIAAKGRDPWPAEVKFVTYTVRYNKCAWVEVERLDKHWERGEVHGTYKDGKFDVKTKGVQSIRIELNPNHKKNTITIDGQTLLENFPGGENAGLSVDKVNGKWSTMETRFDLAKWHGEQGPIDDAFMDRFVFVRPTGKPLNEAVGKWVEKEMRHAVDHWRKQFRGDVQIVDDTEVLKNHEWHDANWILWGDPQSNKVFAKMADKFPIKWTEKGVAVGDKTYDAGTHVPAFIYKKPTGDGTYFKYVVINSGFTFREYDYLNNARQVPKLPDYEVIDVTTPPNSRYPGKVVRAGFFGEKWEMLPDDGK